MVLMYDEHLIVMDGGSGKLSNDPNTGEMHKAGSSVDE